MEGLIGGGLLAAAGGWYAWERSQRRTRPMRGGLHEDIELPHEQPWELYHNSFSLCSKKTRVCLAELGIDHRSHHIDLIETGAYENISRRFLKVNPAALVPVLVHNGHPIYESHEQLGYAAAHSERGAALMPKDPEKRALIEHWVHRASLIGDDPIAGLEETAGNAVPGLTMPLFAAMIEHIPAHRIVEGLLFHRFKKRPAVFLMLKRRGLKGLPSIKPLVGLVRRSRTAMHRHLDDLETALAANAGPWIAGKEFSLADVGMMVTLERLREADWLEVFLTENRPNLAAYWDALQARPSYQAGVAAFAHPIVGRGLAAIQCMKRDAPAFRAALLD